MTTPVGILKTRVKSPRLKVVPIANMMSCRTGIKNTVFVYVTFRKLFVFELSLLKINLSEFRQREATIVVLVSGVPSA